MDPATERELDALIASVEDEGEASSASADEPQRRTREIARPSGQSEDDDGAVNEGEIAADSDGQEPDEGDEPYEVDVASLTPIQAQPDAEGTGTLQELAYLRQQVNELQGFQSQVQQRAEQAEFAAFLESLKGMDPDEAKDAVSTRVANSYIALQRKVAQRDQQDAQALANYHEQQQRDKAITFMAQGGRRVGDKYLVNKRLALTERETDRLRKAAYGGMMPMALEQMAQDFVDDRINGAGTKRSDKQRQDSQSGASRTLAGAGAAKPPAKSYDSLESLIDDLDL